MVYTGDETCYIQRVLKLRICRSTETCYIHTGQLLGACRVRFISTMDKGFLLNLYLGTHITQCVSLQFNDFWRLKLVVK